MSGRLLLVDDEPDIRETVQVLVEATFPGVEVLTAESGRRAIEILSASTVDGVVTDYRMPGMDGADFALEVRKRWPTVPVIMLTAYIDEQTKAAIEGRVPGLEILPKPVDLDSFLPRIGRLLQRQPRGLGRAP